MMRFNRWPPGGIAALWLIAGLVAFGSVLVMRARATEGLLRDPRFRALTDTAAYARLSATQRADVDSFRQSFALSTARLDTEARKRQDLFVVLPPPRWGPVHSPMQQFAPYAPLLGALMLTLLWHRGRQRGDAGV